MVKRVTKNTKVLFVNPMWGIEGFLPIGLSSLVAVLEDDGFAIDIFDTTYYDSTEYDDRKVGEFTGEYKQADLSAYGVYKEKGDYLADFNAKVQTFKPNLIAITIPTGYNIPMAMELINGLKDYNGHLIIGGKGVIVNPDKFCSHPKIDIICIGEGESSLKELCNRMENGQPFEDIQNLWVKGKDGTYIKNELGILEEMDTLPVPSWENYDKRHFFRPYEGKVYRYGHVEFSRGCPHRCSYCINDALQRMYKGKGKFYRKKSVDRIIKELKYLKDTYKIEMFKFWDEEFMLISEEDLAALAEGYKEVNLPFLITARLDGVTETKARLLKEMGCVNVSAGIETGSERVRKNVLNRRMSDEEMIKGIQILNKYDIRTSTLNMIGMPYETREDVFKTIELNRISNAQNSSIMILKPWEGTRIREMAIDAGYLDPNNLNYNYDDSDLDMPHMSKEEIRGLAKTFSLYRKVPKVFFPVVKICEKEGKWRNRLFRVMHQVFK